MGRPRVNGGAAVRLARFDHEYLGVVRGWIADPELRDLVGTSSFPSETEHEKWYKRITEDPTRYTAVVLDGEDPVGLAGLMNIDRNSRKAELWIYIGVAAERRRGIGTAAVGQVLTTAFRDLELHRVYVHVFGFNDAAHGFFASAGFRDEGVEREAVFKRGRFHDVWLMGLLAPEFHGA